MVSVFTKPMIGMFELNHVLETLVVPDTVLVVVAFSQLNCASWDRDSFLTSDCVKVESCGHVTGI